MNNEVVKKVPHRIFDGFRNVSSALYKKEITIDDRQAILKIMQESCKEADESDIDAAINYYKKNH